MKFEINDTTWTIEEIDEAKMKEEAENDYTMGLTIYKPQKIYILKEQANKIKTLKHELVHVWLYEYGHAQNDERKYHFEELCEIVSSSNNFINKVIKKYEEVSNEKERTKKTR